MTVFQLTVFKALDTLHNAIDGNEDAYHRILKELNGLKAEAPKRSPTVQRKRGGDITTPNPQGEIRGSAITPNAPSILERPYPILKGRRRRIVPRLIVTNGVPFLRYKKPQPPNLSRVINDKIMGHERRIGRTYEYQDQSQMGKLEDDWDEDLSRYCGLSIRSDGGQSWRKESDLALAEVKRIARRHAQRNKEMTLDMYNVMEKERALAEKERHAGREERHRRYKAKRLARREAEQREEPDLREPAVILD